MDYSESMSYISNTQKFGRNFGLERTNKILEFLGNPHKNLKCIHIAGTNGKGSTTAMLTEVLCEAGFEVGMYISPYLEEFEERIQISGKNISKEDLAMVVTEVSLAVNKVLEQGYDNPTEFEIITCCMLKYFFEKKVDFAVIEVGLGGRLDSTNVITPILSIITSISYDHMDVLGNTLTKIAYEKAGIIKNNIPVVIYPQDKESLEVIKKICLERNSKLIEVPVDCVELIETRHDDKSKISYKQNLVITTLSQRYNIWLALLGKHQLLNCATVIYAVEALRENQINIDKNHIIRAMSNVKWPGRLEVLSNEPTIIIDGAHNIDAIEKLTESLDIYFTYNKLYLILGILADKQVREMVSTITPRAAKVIAVTPHSERAELAEELKKIVMDYNGDVVAIENYEEALKEALSYCEKDDLILISGSLHMIGDMRTVIKKFISDKKLQ